MEYEVLDYKKKVSFNGHNDVVFETYLRECPGILVGQNENGYQVNYYINGKCIWGHKVPDASKDQHHSDPIYGVEYHKTRKLAEKAIDSWFKSI